MPHVPVCPTPTRYPCEFTKADPQDGTQSRDRNPRAQNRRCDAWIGLGQRLRRRSLRHTAQAYEKNRLGYVFRSCIIIKLRTSGHSHEGPNVSKKATSIHRECDRHSRLLVPERSRGTTATAASAICKRSCLIAPMSATGRRCIGIAASAHKSCTCGRHTSGKRTRPVSASPPARRGTGPPCRTA